MKKCPYWSKSWSACMIKTKANPFTDRCVGNLNAGCIHFRTAELQRMAQEESYAKAVEQGRHRVQA